MLRLHNDEVINGTRTPVLIMWHTRNLNQSETKVKEKRVVLNEFRINLVYCICRICDFLGRMTCGRNITH